MWSRRRTGFLRSGALVAAVAIGSGCRSSDPSESVSLLPGRYSLTWTRGPATCVPQNLPAPLSSDTSKYASVPQAQISDQLIAQVEQTGDSVALIPLNATGSQMTSLALRGLFEEAIGLALLTRSGSGAEGPRVGGHSFSVNEAHTDSVTFIRQFETPPGNRTEVLLSGKGLVTLTFRDDGGAGSVYTTCSFTETLSAPKFIDQ